MQNILKQKLLNRFRKRIFAKNNFDNMNSEFLKEIVTQTMPFGKYKGTKLYHLPISYLEWLIRKNAIPKGKLGMCLFTIYEIKLNGLEYLLPIDQ